MQSNNTATKVNYSEMSKRYNLHSWAAQRDLDPTEIINAEGIYYWDVDGNKYYDMSSQAVNMNLGHGNKAMIATIKEQAEKLAFIGPGFAYEARSKAAKAIVEFSELEGAKVFFTNAGAESNDNAVKMARAYTGKWKMLSSYYSYHGASLGASSLTGEERRFSAEPGMSGFIHFEGPYPYRAASQIQFKDEADVTDYYLTHLEQMIKRENPDAIAGIILETVVGSNGLLIPPEGYLPGVRKLCDKYGIVLICDEVMAGFYRTGKKFAFHNFGIKPDLVTFAKGVTCGYVPLGGVIVSKPIAEYYDDHKMYNGLTYSAHPIGCAVACTTIEEYKRLNIEENVAKTGKILGEQLEQLKKNHKCVGDVRYIGLFSMAELVADRETREPLSAEDMSKIGAMLSNEGFAVNVLNNNLLIAPPLIITESELLDAMEILDKVLYSADKMIT